MSEERIIEMCRQLSEGHIRRDMDARSRWLDYEALKQTLRELCPQPPEEPPS